MTSGQPRTVREAVGIFRSARDIENAIEELQENGFPGPAISLLASDAVVREKLGHRYHEAKSLEDDRVVPRTVFVATAAPGDAEGGLSGGLFLAGELANSSMAVVSGGSFGISLIAASVGTGPGGQLGGILALLVGEHHSHYLQLQLQHGGLLVWVRTKDTYHEVRAIEVYRYNNAHHGRVHDVEVRHMRSLDS